MVPLGVVCSRSTERSPVSRYGDDPVHLRRVQREYRREIARLVSDVAVRAAADSGVQLLPALAPVVPGRAIVRPVIPQQRTTPPGE
jgi:hypothetical protein